MFNAPLQLEDVHTAINQMHLKNSPGPDNMNPASYQKNCKHCAVLMCIMLDVLIGKWFSSSWFE